MAKRTLKNDIFFSLPDIVGINPRGGGYIVTEGNLYGRDHRTRQVARDYFEMFCLFMSSEAISARTIKIHFHVYKTLEASRESACSYILRRWTCLYS